MENLNVIDVMENENLRIEVLENVKLSGARSGRVAEQLFYMEKSGIKLKNVKVTLKKGALKVESGALFFMKGKVNVKSKPSKGLLKNLGTNLLAGEKMFKPEYSGEGEIWLEPSFGHFKILELNNEEIIVDKGMFYGCDSDMGVSAVMQKNISSAMLGGEGLFQTKIRGTGLVVLSIPVPLNEVMIYQLHDEELKVDGNFAILRKGNIEYSIQMVSKGIIGTMISGEGLVETFKGSGEVWLAPTQSIYEKMNNGHGMHSVPINGSSNTKTK